MLPTREKLVSSYNSNSSHFHCCHLQSQNHKNVDLPLPNNSLPDVFVQPAIQISSPEYDADFSVRKQNFSNSHPPYLSEVSQIPHSTGVNPPKMFPSVSKIIVRVFA
jgi:hypothetical protein